MLKLGPPLVRPRRLRSHLLAMQNSTHDYRVRGMSRRDRDVRVPSPAGRAGWQAARAAVVICDMWDNHHCVSAAQRVAAMAGRMNTVVADLRAQGALIIHAPGGCSDFYRDTSARNRALGAPYVKPPRPPDWNGWDRTREADLPSTLMEPGACSCDSREPCGQAWAAWTRQIPTIVVAPEDAVTDDGQELYNLLMAREIVDVVVMGVHTNICVLGRPYGIRQLVYWQLRPVVCRDLTDSFHRDPRGHGWGTDQTVAHIERYWCSTVTSDELVGPALRSAERR